MKKYFKLLPILLLMILSLVSCDNDASSGILSNIVNSEYVEDYNIRAVTADSNNTYFYTVEDYGIYKLETSTETKTVLLDTSIEDNIYNNIQYIYYDETPDPNRLYFIYSLYDEEEETTTKTLAYIEDPENSTNATPIDITNTEYSIIELTSNGYLLYKDDTKYYSIEISEIDDSLSSSLLNRTIGSSSLYLSDTIVVGDEIIIQTVDEDSDDDDEFTYSYLLPDTTYSTDSDYIEISDNKKIVAAIKDTNDYYFVLDDGLLYSTSDGAELDIENLDDDDYDFDVEAQTLTFEDTDNNVLYLVTFDDSNNVLAYKIYISSVTAEFEELTEGFANELIYSSDIVGTFINQDSNNGYYVVTVENGYYDVSITNLNTLLDDDDDNSEIESVFTNI